MSNYIVAGKTDVGMARQVNEDNMTSFDSPNGMVVAVCDGMGGAAAGDVASKLACDIIRDILENNHFIDPLEGITKAIMAANQGILHRTQLKPEYSGMGATCVLAIIRDGKVYYGWVGDSRIYYISGHTISQLSKDQSYVQMLVDSGQITAAEAENHPQKNEITNALGMANMAPPQLCNIPLTPEPGSMLLLCSDGLSGMVDPMQIEQICSQPGLTTQERANQLIDRANANGGFDNVTVELVEFTGAAAAGASRSNARAAGANAVVQREKNKRTVIYSVAAVFIVALLGAGAWFYFDNKAKEEALAKEKVVIETKDNRSAQPTTSDPVARPDQRPSAPSVSTSPRPAAPSVPSTPVVNQPKQQKKPAVPKVDKKQTGKDVVKQVNDQQKPKPNPKQKNEPKSKNQGDEL